MEERLFEIAFRRFFVTLASPLSRCDPIPLMRPCFELLHFSPSLPPIEKCSPAKRRGTGAFSTFFERPKVKSLVKRPIGPAFGGSRGWRHEEAAFKESGGGRAFVFARSFVIFFFFFWGGTREDREEGMEWNGRKERVFRGEKREMSCVD